MHAKFSARPRAVTRCTAVLVCAAATATALVGPAAPASAAGAVTYNWGACMNVIPIDYRSALAPGQSDIGPLTVVKGEIVHDASSFAGGMGCLR